MQGNESADDPRRAWSCA